jgi:branched-chain amino acid transport system substrate-binding protein
MRQCESQFWTPIPRLAGRMTVNTGESDHLPVEQLQFMRFTGKQWERFGEVLSTK